ncbi:MAG: hypothetical protein FJ218_02270 [Ignavibacteria bacterium]|nr:hypothetical protein [Ignavibacteria bacterium]
MGDLKEKSFGNAFIPPTNLGLMDKNGHLTSEGISLANTFISNRKDFHNELAYLLLTRGNFLAILQSIEKYDHKISPTELMNKITEFLNKEKLIIGSKNLKDFANRLSGNHLHWLVELELLTKDKKGYRVNWVRVCNILRSSQ